MADNMDEYIAKLKQGIVSEQRAHREANKRTELAERQLRDVSRERDKLAARLKLLEAELASRG